MEIKKENIDLLFQKICNDDIHAYNELYELFYAPLCSFATRYLNGEQDREDCVQDIFCKIWSDRKSLNIVLSAKAYLLTATKNRCLNFIEKRGVQQSYEQYILNTYDSYTVDNLYSLKELESNIYEAISKLPLKYQTIFRMSRFNNLSYKEIAEQEKISIKTVELYISKSLSLLSKSMKDFFSFFIF